MGRSLHFPMQTCITILTTLALPYKWVISACSEPSTYICLLNGCKTVEAIYWLFFYAIKYRGSDNVGSLMLHGSVICNCNDICFYVKHHQWLAISTMHLFHIHQTITTDVGYIMLETDWTAHQFGGWKIAPSIYTLPVTIMNQHVASEPHLNKIALQKLPINMLALYTHTHAIHLTVIFQFFQLVHKHR